MPTTRTAYRLTRLAILGALLAHAASALAAPATITLPGERVFPESLTSDRAGTLYVGSMAEGGIRRVAPGAAAAEPWIEPMAGGSRSIFGVLADDAAGTLWACSNDVSAWGIPGPGDAKGSLLKGFDLRSGKPTASAALPGEGATCNDIALGPKGEVYVTDVIGSRVLKLRPGHDGFDVWASDARFTPPPDQGGLDGIVLGSDGALYVTTFGRGELFRIERTQDGAAGRITRLTPSQPLTLPDTLRRYGKDQLLLVEGGGRLDRVTIAGDTAQIEVLRDGLNGPVSVTQVGETAWVAEGQLDYLFEPALKDQKPRLPFRLIAVPLPQR